MRYLILLNISVRLNIVFEVVLPIYDDVLMYDRFHICLNLRQSYSSLKSFIIDSHLKTDSIQNYYRKHTNVVKMHE